MLEQTDSKELSAWGFEMFLKLDMPSGSVHAGKKGFQDRGRAWLTQQFHSVSSLNELTRFHLHSGLVCITLTLCISHFQMKCVGSLDQVGKKEDRVAI